MEFDPKEESDSGSIGSRNDEDFGREQVYGVDEFNDFEENLTASMSEAEQRRFAGRNISPGEKEDDMNRVHVLSRGARATSSANEGS